MGKGTEVCHWGMRSAPAASVHLDLSNREIRHPETAPVTEIKWQLEQRKEPGTCGSDLSSVSLAGHFNLFATQFSYL